MQSGGVEKSGGVEESGGVQESGLVALLMSLPTGAVEHTHCNPAAQVILLL